MKRVTLTIWILTFLILPFNCREKTKQKSIDTIQLKWKKVDRIRLIPSIRTSGKLSSKLEFRLSFKTGGVIDQIPVDEGKRVNKGDLLAQLELSEIQSKVDQARLAVNKAERDFQRAKNLYADSVVTLEIYQNAKTALDAAISDLKIAEFNFNHSSIEAPARGLVLKKMAEENEIIAPGHPVIYFASTENDWIMRVNVTDKDRVRLNLSDSAEIFFDAYPERIFHGVISEMAEIADPYTGTFEIELSLIDTIHAPVNGLIGSANLFPSQPVDLPLIPYEALLEGDGMFGLVYVIRNGLPEKRGIGIYALDERGILVKNGLSPGDSIVIEGGPYLRDDSRFILSPTTNNDSF
jgi:RND family efflux transporter MFP subunit